MLFNSVEFIFLFLPITLLGFFTLARLGQIYATTWLLTASLFFYGWWDWKYLGLLLGSITFHFIVGARLLKLHGKPKKLLLIAAIAIDLAALIYFKYADMFVGTWNSMSSSQVPLLHIILPLGISFFTFTQIAYLVDVYEGKVKEMSPIHFGLFVTYFPHLIAGPVLHHKEMMPQFASKLTYVPRYSMFALGTSIFALGLAKKVLLADNLSSYANAFFSAPADSGLLQAWNGVLAYSFQLYFDFSGYSDMAVGLSIMLGIKLPINFFSPYKSKNISEFWRRWHMTLSRFLRDYLYIKMGGNRRGKTRRYFNLIMTMFLGGLWHGAGWNFAIWGLMHGAYLCLHEAWRATIGHLIPENKLTAALAVLFTFLCVVFAWVPFRANGLSSTVSIWQMMIGLNGVSAPEAFFSSIPALGRILSGLGITQATGGGSVMVFGYAWITIAALIAFFAPNTYQIHRKFRAAIIDKDLQKILLQPTGLRAQFKTRWAVGLALLLTASFMYLARPSEFLYFQF